MMVSVRPEQARGEFPVVELPKIFFLKSKIHGVRKRLKRFFFFGGKKKHFSLDEKKKALFFFVWGFW